MLSRVGERKDDTKGQVHAAAHDAKMHITLNTENHANNECSRCRPSDLNCFQNQGPRKSLVILKKS